MGGKLAGGKRVKREIAGKINEALLFEMGDLCDQWLLCGSYRRNKEEVGDLDIVVVPKDPKVFNDALAKKFGFQKDGKKAKGSGLVDGVQVDFFIATKENWWSQVLMWTGSMKENVRLRAKAKSRGYSVSQYGLKDVKTGEVRNLISEQELYEILGEQYLVPWERG